MSIFYFLGSHKYFEKGSLKEEKPDVNKIRYSIPLENKKSKKTKYSKFP